MAIQPLQFKFNSQKAAEAAAQLLQMAGGTLNYMVLVKLMYLADRNALIKYECPITGDRLVSLPYGPVLSRVLNLIKWGPIDESDEHWFTTISPPDGYEVKLIRNPGTANLTGAEEAVLKTTFETYGRKTWQELSRITHELPEWVNPDGGSIPISPEQILLFSGMSVEDVSRLRDERVSLNRLDQEIAQYEGCEYPEETSVT